MKTLSVSVSYRLRPAKVSSPEELRLTPEEYSFLEEAAERSGKSPGLYVKALLLALFGERASEVVALHASEIGMPVRSFVRTLTLAAVGFPENAELETYRELARKAGRTL
jgi:uncharacterized protein (DUF1778 family)